MKSMRDTVESMAGLNKPKETHPWFALAVAVQAMLDSGKHKEAIKFLEEKFNDATH